MIVIEYVQKIIILIQLFNTFKPRTYIYEAYLIGDLNILFLKEFFCPANWILIYKELRTKCTKYASAFCPDFIFHTLPLCFHHAFPASYISGAFTPSPDPPSNFPNSTSTLIAAEK